MAKQLLHNPQGTTNDLLDWIQLSRSENVGPLTFHRLMKQYGSPRHALMALPELAAKGGLKRPLIVSSRKDCEAELESVQKYGAQMINLHDPSYPPLLKHIDSAPPLLTVKGHLELAQKHTFAIVGSRNASALGKKMAQKLADELGDIGWVIASGLARGIDTAAHNGSLPRGTIAVLAGGVDNIYPQENEGLYHQIEERGLIIAESPFGTKPQATLFPRRNRIISGLSRGVLVVEAALKSGSLVTARYALEQGRDVYAIPAHPLDPRARGCNQLIKNGAILVESIEDITNEVFPSINKSEESPQEPIETHPSQPLYKCRKIINENLSISPISVDEMIRQCHLSPKDVWSVLLEMEIAGRLERLSGGRVALKEEWKNI